MTNIINFTGVTKLDLNPDKVLQSAVGNLSEVVICGLDKDGNQYFASSKGNEAEVLWHLEKAKKTLLELE